MQHHNAILTATTLLAALALGGCASDRPPTRGIRVVADVSTLPGEPVAVHVIPTAEIDHARVDDYFDAPPPTTVWQSKLDPARVHDGDAWIALTPRHPAYRRWRSVGIARVTVIADPPGRFGNLPILQDPRQIEIDLPEEGLAIVRLRPEGLTAADAN